MGLLDGVLGGVVGSVLTKIVGSYVESHGGVAGIVSQFEQSGLGDTVKSWVGTGENLPISAEQISQVLGNDNLMQMAEKFGIPTDQIKEKLAEYLPQAIDQMTPNGEISTAA